MFPRESLHDSVVPHSEVTFLRNKWGSRLIGYFSLLARLLHDQLLLLAVHLLGEGLLGEGLLGVVQLGIAVSSLSSASRSSVLPLINSPRSYPRTARRTGWMYA